MHAIPLASKTAFQSSFLFRNPRRPKSCLPPISRSTLLKLSSDLTHNVQEFLPIDGKPQEA